MLSIQNISIELNGLEKLKIVDSFSLEVLPGESVALVGESGAGKSSVLFSLLGLLRKSFVVNGRILFCGSDLLAKSEKAMRLIRGKEIGLVFQNCLQSFDPVFRVGTQLDELLNLYYPNLRRVERQKLALQILEEVELKPADKIRKMFVDELSGGMVQRLAIAFALSAKPKLLLADELTSALDKSTEEKVMQLLVKINKLHQTGFLWVTHDLSLAEKFADRVVVMKEGKIVEKGETTELIHSPVNEYTRYLIESMPTGSRCAN